MGPSVDLDRKLNRVQRLLVGVGNLVLLEEDVEHLMQTADNHAIKIYTIGIVTPCSAQVLQKYKKESDPEFNDLRRLIRTKIHNHREYVKRARALISAVRVHEQAFDWDVIIHSEEVPICLRYKRAGNGDAFDSESDRKFLKSLRIASDPPQTVDRKS